MNLQQEISVIFPDPINLEDKLVGNWILLLEYESWEPTKSPIGDSLPAFMTYGKNATMRSYVNLINATVINSTLTPTILG